MYKEITISEEWVEWSITIDTGEGIKEDSLTAYNIGDAYQSALNMQNEELMLKGRIIKIELAYYNDL